MWDLSEKTFYQLLDRLHSDPTLAGEEYENLRTRLIFFLERKGCRISAELADETINRMARKIEEGYEIAHLGKFSYGVARLVLLEHWQDPKREWEQLDERPSPPESNREFNECRLECMKKCLEALSPEEQNLIVKNCTLNKQGREKLAEALGLTINAFRLRVFRIRVKLHQCRDKCLEDS